MTEATVKWTDKGPLVTFEAEGVRASMRVIESRFPDKFDRHSRDIHAMTFLGIARLSPVSRSWPLSRFIELLAHEWQHAWREKKLGRLNHAWTYLFKFKEMERDADRFDTKYRAAFVNAATELRTRAPFKPLTAP